MPSLEAGLARLSKSELITLIRRMVERHEDLELLVEMAAIVPGASVDVEEIGVQVRRAFGNTGYEWGASFRLAGDLERVMEAGDDAAEADDWRGAAAVYRVMLDRIREGYETIHDEEGEVAQVAGLCAEKLGSCLAELDEAVEREVVLHTLFTTYTWDVDLGGYGIGDSTPDALLEHASSEERRLMAQWIRGAMPPGDPDADAFLTGWKRSAYGGFLLRVQKDELDPETYLQTCRETGRWRDLVERLLELERVDEAVEEVARRRDRELLQLLPYFEQYRQADRIEPIVRERAEESEGRSFLPWLKERAEKQGDVGEALALSERIMWNHPTVGHYAEVKRLAQQFGRWGKVRASIEERLQQQQDFSFLTQIHLYEGEVGQALQCLEQAQASPGRPAAWSYLVAGPLVLQVARAAEESHPLDAIRLYRQAAERLIDRRGRSNYQEAAGLFSRVRDLYRSLDREEEWRRCIESVRTEHSNLPALKDELKKAGL